MDRIYKNKINMRRIWSYILVLFSLTSCSLAYTKDDIIGSWLYEESDFQCMIEFKEDGCCIIRDFPDSIISYICRLKETDKILPVGKKITAQGKWNFSTTLDGDEYINSYFTLEDWTIWFVFLKFDKDLFYRKDQDVLYRMDERFEIPVNGTCKFHRYN